MARNLLCALASLALVLGAAQSSTAAPIDFFFSSGSMTITATAGTTQVLSATVLPMDGVFVTFDPVTIDVVDFLFTIPNSGSIALDAPYGGYDTIVLESADVSPGLGYSTVFGSGGPTNFSFIAGPTDINGIISATDSTLTNPPIVSLPVPFTDDSFINGSIDTDLLLFELIGITLTELSAALFPGATDDLILKADVTFSGAVPEPTTATLLAIGLVGLAANRRRS